MVLQGEPEGPAGAPELVVTSAEDLALTYQSGVEPKARSQWAYARIRFFRHKLAVISLFVLLACVLIAIFADQVAPYGYDELDLFNTTSPPTLEGKHLFGTDLLGRDYLSRVIFGMRTSLWVAFTVAFLSTTIGTSIGALAGYFGGAIDNLLMRFTDLILTLPGLAVLLTAAAFFGTASPFKVAIILALLFWTGIARIVRGVFLSLREKEYVEAAKASGGSDLRIIVRHMLPNSLGPDHRQHHAHHRRRHPGRGRALVPRLWHPAAPPVARLADRRGTGRGNAALVARHLPGPHDRVDRARDQLRRRRPARCARSDPAESSCLIRFFRFVI